MKKQYSRIMIEINEMVEDVILSSLADNLVEDDLFDEEEGL